MFAAASAAAASSTVTIRKALLYKLLISLAASPATAAVAALGFCRISTTSRSTRSMTRSSARLGLARGGGLTPMSMGDKQTQDPFDSITPDSVVSGRKRRTTAAAAAAAAVVGLDVPTFQKPSSTASFPATASVAVTPSPEDIVSTASFSSSRSSLPLVTPLVTRTLFPTNDEDFVDLQVAPAELRPSATLTTGQCFHWQVIVSTEANMNDAASDTMSEQVQTTQPQATNRKRKHASAWGTHDAKEWIGTLRVTSSSTTTSGNDEDDDDDDTLVVVLRELPDTVWYRTLHAPATLDVRSFLYAYFQLPDKDDDETHGDNQQPSSSSLSMEAPDKVTSLSLSRSTSLERVSLCDLYDEWSTHCPRLSRIAACLPGVRIIRQDPWECLVSFLCSSNNNIPRITKMLQAIRRRYGRPIVNVTTSATFGPGQRLVTPLSDQNDSKDEASSSAASVQLYSFPSLAQLSSQATESDLRTQCGMGYRAKYLMETMKTLTELGGESYLHRLRTVQDNDPIAVQDALLQFCGVGRKVADCVALFSLDSVNAVPVDVHVWNIARRDYGADNDNRSTKSLTPTVYRQIGDLFRSKFPVRTGWAHSLLFVAELPSFRDALPRDMVDEMDQFRTDEKAKKESLRQQKKSS